jgi:quinate dehydrogenase
MATFSLPDPSSLDRVAHLVGFPIAHSLSPLLHHTIFSNLGMNWAELLYETKDLDSFVALMRSEPKIMGAAITMPYKMAIIPHLDELTPEGEAIGAINTIFLKTDSNGSRRYCGTNTDCIGVREGFTINVPDPSIYRGKPGLVIGGGGTSRAAIYAFQHFLGCSPIYMVNRDKSEVDAVISDCNSKGFGEDVKYVSTVSEAKRLAPPGAIVSAVPNFPPRTAEEKMARKIVETFLNAPQKGALLEMCYHPTPNTEIDALAREKGWQVIMGTEAMIGQGLEQAKLWSGIEVKDLPRDAARTAVRNAINKEREA